MIRKILLLLLAAPLFASAQPVAPDLQMPAGKLYIDKATIPHRRPGIGVERAFIGCTGTLAACQAGGSPWVPNVKSTLSEQGGFRIGCGFSHASFDDPIVWPGRPGKTHLHVFFGNTTTGAASDLYNMPSSGNSTCAGGTINRTGYWTPTLVYHCPAGSTDGCTRSRDGEITMPAGNNVYYKSSVEDGNARRAQYRWFPPGLRMIAGDPNNTAGPQYGINFSCTGNASATGSPSGPAAASPYPGWATGSSAPDAQWNHIPTTAEVNGHGCDELIMLIFFPGCWDGVNLDSPDHKSHMGYSNDAHLCADDPTHPVMTIAGLSYNIHFRIGASGRMADLTYLRLTSDLPKSSGLPGGHSAHGDWVNGWKQGTPLVAGGTRDVTQLILDTCLRRPALDGLGSSSTTPAGADCHDDVIGNADDNPTHWWGLQ